MSRFAASRLPTHWPGEFRSISNNSGTYLERRVEGREDSEESRLVAEYEDCLNAVCTRTAKRGKYLDQQSRREEAFAELLIRLDRQMDVISEEQEDESPHRYENNAIDREHITYPDEDDRVPAALTCLFPHEIHDVAHQDAAIPAWSSESSWASPSEYDDGDDGQELAGVTTQDSHPSALQGTRIERWVQGVDVRRERSHQDQRGESAASAASRPQARLSSRLDDLHLYSPRLAYGEGSLSPVSEAVDSDADFEDVREKGHASTGVEEPHKLRAADPYRERSDPRSSGGGRERDTSPGFRQSRYNYHGSYQEDDPTHVRHGKSGIRETRSESHRHHRARQAETEVSDEVDRGTMSMMHKMNAAKAHMREKRAFHAYRSQEDW